MSAFPSRMIVTSLTWLLCCTQEGVQRSEAAIVAPLEPFEQPFNKLFAFGG